MVPTGVRMPVMACGEDVSAALALATGNHTPLSNTALTSETRTSDKSADFVFE